MILQALAAAAGLTVMIAAPAAAQDAPPQPVIRDTDGVMTCIQIADEAARLSQSMGGPSDAGLFGTLGGVAKAGASTFIPGVGLLFAGADALTRDERDRRAAAALAVQNRWFYLNGLYAGERCNAGPATPGTPAPPPRR